MNAENWQVLDGRQNHHNKYPEPLFLANIFQSDPTFVSSYHKSLQKLTTQCLSLISELMNWFPTRASQWKVWPYDFILKNLKKYL